MINTSEFSKRLQNVIDYYDETASSFAEKIGVQRSSISHILSGRNKPSLDFVMKVLHAYPEVELYWLLNGKGKFPKNQTTTALSSPSDSTEDLNTGQERIKRDNNAIEKIVIFYKDGTFKSYEP